MRPAHEPEDFWGNGAEGKHLVREACVGDRAGHAPYSAGCLILSQYGATAIAHHPAASTGPTDSSTNRAPRGRLSAHSRRIRSG